MTPLNRMLKGLTTTRLASVASSADFWPGFDAATSSFYSSEPAGEREEIESSFEGYVRAAYKANGIVFACIAARQYPFSEALFRYQSMDDGMPGKLSFDASLGVLETPWPNATTGTLLSHMEQDASLSGNAYFTRVGDHLRRLRPDWVTIMSGVRGNPEASPFDIDAEVLGYIYHPEPRARMKRPDPVFLTPDRVAHYAPIPDPEAQWRGMSWLTPVISEIKADLATTKHKLKYFENGTTGGMVVTYDASVKADAFERYVQLYKDAHQGVDTAYKTIHLGGGSDIKSVGSDLKQLDFKATQGAGETRIAAAAGVGAIMGRFSEGLQGSSLNAGNYGAAKRQFADMTIRPLWRTASAALSKFTTPPEGSRLWYAEKHIEFLQEDALDAADIFDKRAQSIRTLTDGGYEPESIIAAVMSENPSLLVHSGRTSVQLQEPLDGSPVA